MAAEDPSLSMLGDRNRRAKKGSGKVSSAIVWLSSVSSRGHDPVRLRPPGSRATARGAPVTLADALQVGSQRCQCSIITFSARRTSTAPLGQLFAGRQSRRQHHGPPAVSPYAGRGRLCRSRGDRAGGPGWPVVTTSRPTTAAVASRSGHGRAGRRAGRREDSRDGRVRRMETPWTRTQTIGVVA